MPRSEPAEPTLPARAFSVRCANLASKLSPALSEKREQVACGHEIPDPEAFIFFSGPAGEIIGRNLGEKQKVLKLCAISEEFFVWVGYREHWRRGGSERNFRFVSAGFTFYVGRIWERYKLQFMRSEWVSKRSPEFNQGIGHPHWQVDAIETIRRHQRQEQPSFGSEPGDASVLPRLDNGPNNQDIETLLKMRIERMHLASAAAWWQTPPAQIAHSPKSIGELDHWIVGCISYFRQELKRC